MKELELKIIICPRFTAMTTIAYAYMYCIYLTCIIIGLPRAFMSCYNNKLNSTTTGISLIESLH